MFATIFMFVLYLAVILAIGLSCYGKTRNVEDYLIGSRGVGSLVTALSAGASDMSGWLFMGLPGVIYMTGLCSTHMVIGLWIGTLLNWLLVAPRLRLYTESTGSVTLSTFLARRFRDNSGVLQFFTAAVILFFFTIYAASGLIAAGKLFGSIFGLSYPIAVVIGTSVILIYLGTGGYLAVCRTNLIQATLMLLALVTVSFVASYHLPYSGEILYNIKPAALDFLPPRDSLALSLVAVVSMAAWGLGYFGQPHLLIRFMSIKSASRLSRTTIFTMIWTTIVLFAAVQIGLLAIPMYQNLDAADSEKVFIFMVRDLFNPWIGGLLLAAVLAAIMSTIDSQLLVASSALTADFYRKILRRPSTPVEQLRISRLFVAVITLAALALALNPDNDIFSLVTFAWGGFGAAFGPIVLMALFSRRTSRRSALGGMIVGTAVMIAWYTAGLNQYLYEILPGFLAGLATILILNRFTPETGVEVLKEFDEVRALHRAVRQMPADFE